MMRGAWCVIHVSRLLIWIIHPAGVYREGQVAQARGFGPDLTRRGRRRGFFFKRDEVAQFGVVFFLVPDAQRRPQAGL